MKKIKLLSILLIVMFLVTSCSNYMAQGSLETDKSSIYKRNEVKYCEITANKVDVKSGLGDNFTSVATLNRGEKVRVLSEIGKWYVVRPKNERLGGIKQKDAKPIVPEKAEEDTPGNGQQEEEPDQQEEPPVEEEPEETDPVQEPQEPTEPEEPQNNDEQTEIDPVDSLNSMEREMVDLVNQERRKNDLTPLSIDYKVTKVARIKAQDMVDNNYFSHYSPTYGSPFDMLNKFGIEYLRAAENLAGNSNVERAHESLMGSSGHRQNILNPHFTHIGIGIKQSDRYGYIFVQMFIEK